MVAKLKNLWQAHRWMFISAAVVVLAGGSLGAARLARKAPDVPTAEVKRGEFVDYVQLRGELKARKSVLLTAPSGSGELQIVKLARNGDAVKKGDVVVQFDTSNLDRTLAQRRSELKQAEAEIDRMRAQGHMQEEQNVTEQMKSRYDVERARLETSKQEILSTIEGEKNKLSLSNAEQKLLEVDQKLSSDRTGVDADIESRKQKRDKALFEVRQAEANVARMTVRAPIDGLVTLLSNWRAGGFGGNAPEWKTGDRAWPGASIAELPDLSTVRATSRVDESDRGRLKPGQKVIVRVDAVPDKELAGNLTEISPLAKLDFSGWPPAKNFDVAIELEQGDARLRPGMSATERVAVERIPDSILVPAEAVFQKGGRTVAYVLRGSRFEERVVEAGRRSGGQLRVLSGLRPGERVALKDPMGEEQPAGK